MKKLTLTALLTLTLAMTTWGQLPFPEKAFMLDFNRPTREFSVTIAEGTTPKLVAYLYNNDAVFDNFPLDHTARFIHTETAGSTNGIIIESSSVLADRIEFQVTNTLQTATNAIRFAQVIVYDAGTNKVYEWGRGKLVLLESPGTTLGAMLETGFPIPGDGYVGKAGSHTNSGSLLVNGVLGVGTNSWLNGIVFGKPAVIPALGPYPDYSVVVEHVGASHRMVVGSLGTAGPIQPQTGFLFDNANNILEPWAGGARVQPWNWQAAPASAAAAGMVGQIAYDGAYFYICVAANTWKRTPIASW